MTASILRTRGACLLIASAGVCALAWSAALHVTAQAPAIDAVPAPGSARQVRDFLAVQATLGVRAPSGVDTAGPRGPGAVPGPSMAYTSMLPCRIVDTRTVDARLSYGSTLDVFSVLADYSPQGGVADGCGMEGIAPQAVVLNVTAVRPSAAGYATVFPYPEPRPLAASVNYTAGAIVNNTVVAKVDAASPGGRFRLFTYAASDYLVDLVGYYTLNTRRRQRMACYDARTRVFAPSGQAILHDAPSSCDAGHVLMSAQCESTGSTAEAYAGMAMVEWSRTGVVADAVTGQPRVVCSGLDMAPAAAGGGSPIDVVEHCCRAIEDPVSPSPQP